MSVNQKSHSENNRGHQKYQKFPKYNSFWRFSFGYFRACIFWGCTQISSIARIVAAEGRIHIPHAGNSHHTLQWRQFCLITAVFSLTFSTFYFFTFTATNAKLCMRQGMLMSLNCASPRKRVCTVAIDVMYWLCHDGKIDRSITRTDTISGEMFYIMRSEWVKLTLKITRWQDGRPGSR